MRKSGAILMLHLLINQGAAIRYGAQR